MFPQKKKTKLRHKHFAVLPAAKYRVSHYVTVENVIINHNPTKKKYCCQKKQKKTSQRAQNRKQKKKEKMKQKQTTKKSVQFTNNSGKIPNSIQNWVPSRIV